MGEIYKDNELIGYACDGENCTAFIDVNYFIKYGWVDFPNPNSISIDYRRHITTFEKPLRLYFCPDCACLKGIL